ncbi:flagellar basal-body rod protein FlgC [Fodinibius roseus]|uniref:Flagellar basal-body rod protein FlgC n=1 Tax=Fodinibius roseus TaxID=1194090 RepID=A0A1M5HGT5_9BACT|nr:flagellar basal body rod protein FlgC [Fodinibius roseus]SHG15153.1 flagellar basal-body rod protein FlgC [Fodinibius roseus]
MIPDRISSAFQTAAQGLSVQRERINVASQNIANANTTASGGAGNVYKPQSVRTSAPGPANFKQTLAESMSSLKRTRQQHFATVERPSTGGRSANLGPSYEITQQDSFRYEYDPNHPDANEEGMVRYPDIDMVREMTEMVSANKLYEANLSSIEAEKEIMKRSLQI